MILSEANYKSKYHEFCKIILENIMCNLNFVFYPIFV